MTFFCVFSGAEAHVSQRFVRLVNDVEKHLEPMVKSIDLSFNLDESVLQNLSRALIKDALKIVCCHTFVSQVGDKLLVQFLDLFNNLLLNLILVVVNPLRIAKFFQKRLFLISFAGCKRMVFQAGMALFSLDPVFFFFVEVLHNGLYFDRTFRLCC